MRVLSVLSALLLSMVGLAGNAAIYKVVDENGNVTFTDVPPQRVGAEETNPIALSERNDYTAQPSTETTNSRAAPTQPIPEPEAPPATVYRSVAIAWPANDEAVRENAGNITISIAVEPGLDANAGHGVQLFMDGKALGVTSSGELTLENVDRGTHELTAKVVDSDGNVLAASDASTFHMLRAIARRAP